MKKIALILILCASVAVSSTMHAKVDTIKLANALVGTGITTLVLGQCAKWVYDSGKLKGIAKFCLKNPWYPIGGTLIGTGAVLLYKDALIELLSPIVELIKSTK